MGANTFKDIGKACPHLESIDIGFTFRSGVNPTDSHLMEAVERLPNLNSISFDIMWNVTSSGICSVARAMADQLLHLKISANCITSHHYLSDATMEAIGDSCKNLKSFTYHVVHYDKYYQDTAWTDLFTDYGIISLVDKCRHLETLCIWNAQKVTEEAFVTILDMIEQGNAASANPTDNHEGYALRTIDLRGYKFIVTGNPLRIETIGY